tara:strand:+ start:6370 stop:8925 length:2556 start_codon:yes stop_codon:yes gene_type:complete
VIIKEDSYSWLVKMIGSDYAAKINIEKATQVIKTGTGKDKKEYISSIANKEWIKATDSGKKDDIRATLRQLKDYVLSQGSVVGVKEEFLKTFAAGITNITYKNERKIQASDLLSGNFDTNDIKVVRGYTKKGNKTNDVSGLREKVAKLRVKPALMADKTTLSNLDDVVDFFKKYYENYSKRGIRSEISKVVEIPFEISTVFNAKTVNKFSKREKTYKYWRTIDKKFTELEDKLVELNVKLKETKDDSKNIKELVSFLDKNISKLNYIEEFGDVEVSIQDVQVSAYEAFEAFLNNIGALMEAQKVEDVRQVNFQSFRNEEGEIEQGSDIEEEVVGDSLPPQVEKFKDRIDSKIPMDALGLLYFAKELKGLAYLNLEGVKDALDEYMDDLSDEPEKAKYPNLIEDDVKALFTHFKDTLDEIETRQYDNSHLPIFMAEDPALSLEYRELRGRAGEKKEIISEFFTLFKNFLSLDKVSLSSNVEVDMLGLGTGKGGEGTTSASGKTFIWFNYKNFVAGRSEGKQRFDSDSSSTKDAKQLHEEISTLVNEVCVLIADCYLATQFSQYRTGVRLPFEGNFTLRLIAATKPLGEKYKFIVAINKSMIERDTAFIEEDELDVMIKYLKTLSDANNIQNYSNLYSNSLEFLSVLKDTFDGSSELNKTLELDIASILGSIYRLIPDDEQTPLIEKNQHTFPKGKTNVEEAYKDRNANDPTDIYPVQVLVDAIRTKGKNLAYRTVNKPKDDEEQTEGYDTAKVEELLSLLDKVAKSEIQLKLLEAHDMLRILKSKPIIHSMKNENSMDDMQSIISKMENDYRIDMTATEITGIVKAVDSFEGIAKDYGIDAEQVYVLKANFR